MHAREMRAHEMHAYEMHAREMHAHQMNAHQMHAHEMRCTPVRCTPVRCTPIRLTPIRHTSMRYTSAKYALYQGGATTIKGRVRRLSMGGCDDYPRGVRRITAPRSRCLGELAPTAAADPEVPRPKPQNHFR